MPRLYSARVVIATLQEAGFSVVSQKGSHVKMQKATADKTLTAMIPYHKEVAQGTFASILKQAGMTRKEFEDLRK